MKLELTLKDNFDLALLIIAIDTTRAQALVKTQELNKNSAWKLETDDELDRLENIRAQVMARLNAN